jgi:hypothetical protein
LDGFPYRGDCEILSLAGKSLQARMIVCGEAVGVWGLETPRVLGVAGVRGLGTALVLGVEGVEKDSVGSWGKVCEGELIVEVCVAVAVVSLSARSYPAFVRENLK